VVIGARELRPEKRALRRGGADLMLFFGGGGVKSEASKEADFILYL